MPRQDRDELRRRVGKLIWYHTVDLGHGVETPGIYDHRPFLKRYGIPRDLRGKTALDIGTASGYFAFEMEKRGARVTATDLPRWADHDFAPNYVPDLNEEQARSYLQDPFLLAKEALESQVKRREINVYDLSPQTVGVFDLVFCASILLHLTDPVRALRRIRSVTREAALIATAISRDDSQEPRAAFVGHDKAFTWWLPNRPCLEAMARSAGFGRVEWLGEFRLDFRNGNEGHWHGVVRAEPGEAPAHE
jgi:tRNA (mo5U34)-methyltransferase